MTQPDDLDRAPGMGDPAKSDDTAIPGLRTGGAGSAAQDQVSGPSPEGTAGGGYGSVVDSGTPGGTPDGEDVQATPGPGPQTDWLRSAPGASETPEGDGPRR